MRYHVASRFACDESEFALEWGPYLHQHRSTFIGHMMVTQCGRGDKVPNYRFLIMKLHLLMKALLLC